MKEIEVKVLDVKPEEVRAKLKQFGAKKVFEGEVQAIYFDYPEEKLTKAGNLLRLRKVGDKVELCYKGSKEKSKLKIMEEIETNTASFDETSKILEKIGLKRLSEAKKHRESYIIGKVKFEIDTYEKIPAFLEIEAPTEQEIIEYIKKLGYTMEQTTNLSGYQLLGEKYHAKNNSP